MYKTRLKKKNYPHLYILLEQNIFPKKNELKTQNENNHFN